MGTKLAKHHRHRGRSQRADCRWRLAEAGVEAGRRDATRLKTRELRGLRTLSFALFNSTAEARNGLVFIAQFEFEFMTKIRAIRRAAPATGERSVRERASGKQQLQLRLSCRRGEGLLDRIAIAMCCANSSLPVSLMGAVTSLKVCLKSKRAAVR